MTSPPGSGSKTPLSNARVPAPGKTPPLGMAAIRGTPAHGSAAVRGEGYAGMGGDSYIRRSGRAFILT